MQFFRSFLIVWLTTLVWHSEAQTLPVWKQSEAGMSEGYKRGIVITLSGAIDDDSGNKITILISGDSRPGILARFKGKSYLKVVENMTLKAGAANSKTEHITYLDPVSLKEVYSLSPEDGEMTTVEYIRDYPRQMNVGDTINLKRGTTVVEKNPQQIISKSLTSLSLAPYDSADGLFEFCENVVVYKS